MSVATIPEVRLATDPMLSWPTTIEAVQPEAYAISTLWLAADETSFAGGLRFQPGQFNMLYLPGFGEVAISISSDPGELRRIGHTIRAAGSVTRAIARLKPGDCIGIRGPYGNRWPTEEATGKDLIIVAGGIGLAPLRPVIYSVLRRRESFRKVYLMYGARTPADLLYTGEFDRWKAGGIDVFVTVDLADENWPGHVGVVPQLFYRLRVDRRNTVVMTCGPEIMMRFVIYEALARQIPKDAIYISMERNMKCGVGFCGHCQIGPNFICRHGPVLKFSAIEPFFNREDF